MKYFKINLGYSQSVQIDETELSKVLRAQAENGIVYIKNGVVNTKHISSIVPDINRAMGWNEDYKPVGEDFAYIAQETKGYREFLENAEKLIESDQNVLKLK